ncbi:hypothetical protein C8F01DRAFT_1351661 [Mycena amicta]|nr:hypothetical protein C8F01DRAFT_1351661 [Mycena amicta]
MPDADSQSNLHWQLEIVREESRTLIRRDEAGAPGRTLGRVYHFISAKLGGLVNGFARRRGRGPGAAADIILEFFSEQRWKEGSVEDLRSRKQIPAEVLTACDKLVQFAFRTQMPKTQYAAFRKLVGLSTRFPGLKTLFEESDYISSRDSQNDLFRLWDRPEDCHCDPQWHFFCEFAAACVTDHAIFPLIKGRTPTALSSAVAHVSGLSFIEHLLNKSAYDPKAPFLSHLVIRYLGSILGLQHFWKDLQATAEHGPSQLHAGIVDKLLKRGELLLQDLGVDESEEDKTPLLLDEEGVDGYCEAVLLGLEMLFFYGQRRLPARTSIADELWYHNLGSVVRLLRQEKSITLLPRSREIALKGMYAKHLPFHMEERQVETSWPFPTTQDDLADNNASINQPENEDEMVALEEREVNVESDSAPTDRERDGQGDVVSPSNAWIQPNAEVSVQTVLPSPQPAIVERRIIRPAAGPTPSQTPLRFLAATPYSGSNSQSQHRSNSGRSLAFDAQRFRGFAAHNVTTIQRVLNAHRKWSRDLLEHAYPGFPFGTFELLTFGIPLHTASIKLKYKICPDEHYWTLRFDGAKIAAFSVPRRTMRGLRNFAIDGLIVVRALQRSFQAGGKRVELEVGEITDTDYIDPTTQLEVDAFYPAFPLVIRVYHNSTDRRTFPSATSWSVGFYRCGASRCKRMFAAGAYCERHRPFWAPGSTLYANYRPDSFSGNPP